MIRFIDEHQDRRDARPWTEKWRGVLHCLTALRQVYSRAGRLQHGNVEVERRADAFFVERDHVRDRLEHDPAAAVTKAEIDQHRSNSDPLVICNAICNTTKHHTRRSGTTAQIRDVQMTPEGARVTVEVEWALPGAKKLDALTLAEECVGSWREFFSQRGLVEPA